MYCEFCGTETNVELRRLRSEYNQPSYPESIPLCVRCYRLVGSTPARFDWDTAKLAVNIARQLPKGQPAPQWSALFEHDARPNSEQTRGSFHGKLNPQYEKYVLHPADHSPIRYGHEPLPPKKKGKS
jgi:hypothetical protein